MDISRLSQDWSAALYQLTDTGTALAVGLFSIAGEPLYLNQGMSVLLADIPKPLTNAFINPSFTQLLAMPVEAHPVFVGILTLGDGYRINRSLKAKVFRQGDRLLVTGEIDVLELEHFNRQLTQANREINKLQRELIKKSQLAEARLAELQRTQAMLVHAEKMNALGQLVAGVAHEINNPLGFILSNIQTLEEMVAELTGGYLELEGLAQLQRGETDVTDSSALQAIRDAHDIDYFLADRADLFRATRDGLTRIKRLVDDLRTFARLHEAERKSVDIPAAIKSLLSLVCLQMKEKGIAVSTDFAALPPLECYPGELNQVFMNLIVNALQAMEAGGTLIITGRCAGNEIQLRFTDSGCGIADKHLSRVFEPFFTTKPVGSGTGLGLAIAYSIVTERHGGRIEVTSTPGTGTCFTIYLPEKLGDD